MKWAMRSKGLFQLLFWPIEGPAKYVGIPDGDDPDQCVLFVHTAGDVGVWQASPADIDAWRDAYWRCVKRGDWIAVDDPRPPDVFVLFGEMEG